MNQPFALTAENPCRGHKASRAAAQKGVLPFEDISCVHSKGKE